jgi:hypothetical protein
MEVMGGMQIIEIAEMAGFSHAGRDKNKALRSRKSDRARMAYAHYTESKPRSSVTISTTNEQGVLSDSTGERRYWPCAVRRYDREAFLRDKDLLYAEAVAREPNENLWLDTDELVAEHDAVVMEAKVANDLIDDLENLEGAVFGNEERISIADVRTYLGLNATDAHRDMRLANRIADAMKHHGWEKPAKGMHCSRLDHHLLKPVKGFCRPISKEDVARRAAIDATYEADATAEPVGPAQGALGLGKKGGDQ